MRRGTTSAGPSRATASRRWSARERTGRPEFCFWLRRPSPGCIPRPAMKIHEYQAKEILRGFGVVVPRGELVQSPAEAIPAAKELMAGGKPVCVVKAQIHAGGRGKGGGVKIAKSPEEAGQLFSK